jgi:uncharacterized protein (TIGR03437 family)
MLNARVLTPAVLLGMLPVLVAPAARAQFSGLTTTNDGSQLWFASPLPQRGTDQFLWSKIFRIDTNGVTLVAQRMRSSPVPPTNAFVLDQPQASGDGSLLLYRGTLNCGCCSSCFLSEQHSTALLDTRTGQEAPVGANARLSRNGRYLASYSSGNIFNPRFVLSDRAQSVTLFQDIFAPGTVSIASDGTTALTSSLRLQLVKGGVRSTLRSSNVMAAVIDDGAATIIYETQSPRRLFVLDLTTMTTQQLGPDDRASFQATLSADGQWVAYLSTLGATPQVFISHPDGSNWKQLTARDDGIVEVTLSGNGKTVFAITGDQSILHIDAATGETTTLVGPTPTILSVQTTSPGSLTEVRGARLEDASVNIAGISTPILGRSGTAILFQVPWEVPPSANTLTIPEGGAPYFDDAASLVLCPFCPQAIPLGHADPATPVQPTAIHADFESLVTNENPAIPGEILHMYLTAGGAVAPPVATGVANPPSPLSTITASVSVVAAEDYEPIKVYYFGLAPGMIGVWQMDAEIPSGWSRRSISFEMEFYGPNSIAESIYQPPIPVKTGP